MFSTLGSKVAQGGTASLLVLTTVRRIKATLQKLKKQDPLPQQLVLKSFVFMAELVHIWQERTWPVAATPKRWAQYPLHLISAFPTAKQTQILLMSVWMFKTKPTQSTHVLIQ